MYKDGVKCHSSAGCMDEIPKKKTAEYLGTVKINNGQHQAELRRESDPGGSTVVRAVRKSPYVHERWHSAGKLDPDLFAAAEKFRMDFERAGLIGSYARLDLFKTRAGQQEMSDRVALAKVRIRDALNALGRGKDSQSVSCVWSVVGLGLNLDQWTSLVRRDGGAMNADKGAGVLHGCLERLALHYGMIDVGRLGAISHDAAFGRGVKAAMDFISVFASSAQGAKRLSLGASSGALKRGSAGTPERGIIDVHEETEGICGARTLRARLLEK
jgi:Domain of unknown function (DUF6456)